MDRRTFLGGAIAVATSALGAQRRPPNILLFFSDDHAFQAISAYGGGLNHTPNIDRIGREGMRFDNCLVTNSICAPSRAVVLTGTMYPPFASLLFGATISVGKPFFDATAAPMASTGNRATSST